MIARFLHCLAAVDYMGHEILAFLCLFMRLAFIYVCIMIANHIALRVRILVGLFNVNFSQWYIFQTAV